MLRELSRLVRLLEPMEEQGMLGTDGLKMMNMARAAIEKAAGGSQQ